MAFLLIAGSEVDFSLLSNGTSTKPANQDYLLNSDENDKNDYDWYLQLLTFLCWLSDELIYYCTSFFYFDALLGICCLKPKNEKHPNKLNSLWTEYVGDILFGSSKWLLCSEGVVIVFWGSCIAFYFHPWSVHWTVSRSVITEKDKWRI